MSPALDIALGIVLVGGRSTRFGRNKLREPWSGSEGGAWLVDQPLRALRRVGVRRVLAAGACDPAIAERFDGVLADAKAEDNADTGPLGGIVAALEMLEETTGGDAIIALAGDLPHVRAETLIALIDAAARDDSADVIAASSASGEPTCEPCIAIYRRSALPRLRSALRPASASDRMPSLQSLLTSLRLARVIRPMDELVNANRCEDLR
jgi:molybdopterin-guanine dinucleotide biosynthesis protein A